MTCIGRKKTGGVVNVKFCYVVLRSNCENEARYLGAYRDEIYAAHRALTWGVISLYQHFILPTLPHQQWQQTTPCPRRIPSSRPRTIIGPPHDSRNAHRHEKRLLEDNKKTKKARAVPIWSQKTKASIWSKNPDARSLPFMHNPPTGRVTATRFCISAPLPCASWNLSVDDHMGIAKLNEKGKGKKKVSYVCAGLKRIPHYYMRRRSGEGKVHACVHAYFTIVWSGRYEAKRWKARQSEASI